MKRPAGAELVATARTLALAAHGTQRYGEAPYGVHLEAVVGWVERLGGDATMRAAAWLHDAVEDTALGLEQVRTHLGMPVAELVWAVTDAPGPDRASRKIATHRRLARASAEARLLKLADRIANLEASLEDDDLRHAARYVGEHPSFRSALWRRGEHAQAWRMLDELVERARARVASTPAAPDDADDADHDDRPA